MSTGLGHMFSCLMLNRLGGLLDEIALPINCGFALMTNCKYHVQLAIFDHVKGPAFLDDIYYEPGERFRE